MALPSHLLIEKGWAFDKESITNYNASKWRANLQKAMQNRLKCKIEGLEDGCKLPKLLMIYALNNKQLMQQVGESKITRKVETKPPASGKPCPYRPWEGSVRGKRRVKPLPPTIGTDLLSTVGWLEDVVDQVFLKGKCFSAFCDDHLSLLALIALKLNYLPKTMKELVKVLIPILDPIKNSLSVDQNSEGLASQSLAEEEYPLRSFKRVAKRLHEPGKTVDKEIKGLKSLFKVEGSLMSCLCK
ncbi:hypothetical protein M9H77_17371 [Catharanthus roseus]|uniref:Uncharacterized protein n=1 Tax=Catharanthus roseus TaxID=4058 RepID=A0ACC0B4F1_CATRO|nr:hypothetical protein M9H77_17371 [Catharanthus roseus]